MFCMDFYVLKFCIECYVCSRCKGSDNIVDIFLCYCMWSIKDYCRCIVSDLIVVQVQWNGVGCDVFGEEVFFFSFNG